MRRIHLLLLITLLGLSSCDLFRLRESMPPSAEARWHDFATTVDMTLENLSFAYMDSRNMINYSTIFTTDFRFYFAPQDETDFSTPASWAAADEQDMLCFGRVNDIEPLLSSRTARTISNEPDCIAAMSSPTARNSRQRQYGTASEETYGYWNLDKWYDYRLETAQLGLLKQKTVKQLLSASRWLSLSMAVTILSAEDHRQLQFHSAQSHPVELLENLEKAYRENISFSVSFYKDFLSFYKANTA